MRKQLFFISTLIVASIFAGCSKDEEKGNPKALIGTWESKSAISSVNGQSSAASLEGYETVTFHTDGRLESSVGGMGTYTTKGHSITFTFTDPATGNPVVKGPGQSYETEQLGVKFAVNIIEQTYFVNSNSLTIELTEEAAIEGQNVTVVTKYLYSKVLEQ